MAEAKPEAQKNLEADGDGPFFALGVSYAGEQRSFVEQVFESLCDQGGFDRDDLFFDRWHQSLFMGPNGNLKLNKIYNDHCQKIVVFLSEEYRNKHWTNNLEWKRAIIPRLTANENDVCLLRFGKVDINSVEFLQDKLDIIPEVSEMSPEAAAKTILEWYERYDL